jgi:hypothetical protein
MLCTFAVSANAEGKVTYSADADKFIFEPGSDHSPTDLFSEYKGLMPGDVVKQDITVRNDNEDVKVNIFVRSLGAQEGSEDFLSKLHLTVAKSEENEMAYMFDAAADQTAGMTDWVFLGTLYSGGEVNLVLNLDIPIELGDDYQDAIGKIDWEFKAEELPIEPDDPVKPGDNSHIIFYVIVAMLSLFVLFIVAKKRRKQTDQY